MDRDKVRTPILLGLSNPTRIERIHRNRGNLWTRLIQLKLRKKREERVS